MVVSHPHPGIAAPRGALVLHPARHYGVDRCGEFGEGVADPAVKPPAADFSADLLQGILADRGQEPHVHAAVLAPRRAWPEREPQERERDLLAVEPPYRVLAVHDLGFAGM